MKLDYIVMVCTGQWLMTPEDDDMGGCLMTFWYWFAVVKGKKLQYCDA